MFKHKTQKRNLHKLVKSTILCGLLVANTLLLSNLPASNAEVTTDATITLVTPAAVTTTAISGDTEKKISEFYIVTASKLNIRKAESKQSVKIGQYSYGTKVEVTAKHGEWFKTKDGFVHSTYLMSVKQFNNDYDRKSKIVSRGGYYERPCTSITMPSDMTVKEINILIAGTGLEGTAQAIYDVEKNNHINAFYTIAIAKFESANGYSRLAKRSNNLFGAKGSNGYLRYGSKSESIYHFGKFLSNGYINSGRDSLNEINPKYCPPNPKWKSGVIGIIRKDINKLR